MKRFLTYASALTVGLFATASFAGTISGSAHDFSGQGWGTTEICEACHAPHNSVDHVDGDPLWNHEKTAVTDYDLYAGYDMDATPGQPTGSSKLCLSCHDGTVAPDSFGGVTGTVDITTIGAGLSFGTDLSNDHPISIDYAAALAGGELKAETAAVTWAAGGDPGTIAELLDSVGTVQCSSCHDVHNTKASDAADNNLLVVLNDASQLCLTCHDK